MENSLPAFDELYVVSHIRVAGSRDRNGDFRIFEYGSRLSVFTRHVAAFRPAAPLAIVLNGDIIDSLAEGEKRSLWLSCTRRESGTLHDDATLCGCVVQASVEWSRRFHMKAEPAPDFHCEQLRYRAVIADRGELYPPAFGRQ